MTEKLVIVESPIKPNHSTPFWCVLDEKELAYTYTPGIDLCPQVLARCRSSP